MFYLCDIPSVQFCFDTEKALCFLSKWVIWENDTAEHRLAVHSELIKQGTQTFSCKLHF